MVLQSMHNASHLSMLASSHINLNHLACFTDVTSLDLSSFSIVILIDLNPHSQSRYHSLHLFIIMGALSLSKVITCRAVWPFNQYRRICSAYLCTLHRKQNACQQHSASWVSSSCQRSFS